jgi:hypothetical protein
MNSCYICKEIVNSREDLVKHLEYNDHIKVVPNRDYWDQPE